MAAPCKYKPMRWWPLLWLTTMILHFLLQLGLFLKQYKWKKKLHPIPRIGQGNTSSTVLSIICVVFSSWDIFPLSLQIFALSSSSLQNFLKPRQFSISLTFSLPSFFSLSLFISPIPPLHSLSPSKRRDKGKRDIQERHFAAIIFYLSHVFSFWFQTWLQFRSFMEEDRRWKSGHLSLYYYFVIFELHAEKKEIKTDRRRRERHFQTEPSSFQDFGNWTGIYFYDFLFHVFINIWGTFHLHGHSFLTLILPLFSLFFPSPPTSLLLLHLELSVSIHPLILTHFRVCDNPSNLYPLSFLSSFSCLIFMSSWTTRAVQWHSLSK